MSHLTHFRELLELVDEKFNGDIDVYPDRTETERDFVPYEIGAAVVDTLVEVDLDPVQNGGLMKLLERSVQLKTPNWQDIENARRKKASDLNRHPGQLYFVLPIDPKV